MIADASTLIIFGKVNRLDLLFSCFQKIIITAGVYAECCTEGLNIHASDAMLIDELVQQSSITVVPLSKNLLQKTEQMRLRYPQLGDGEAESIILALDRHESSLLLDDKLARHIAILHGLKPRGTLYILMHLYRKQILKKQEVKDITKLLLQHNFRLSSDVLAEFWDLLDKDTNAK